jgi:hypothetical protein
MAGTGDSSFVVWDGDCAHQTMTWNTPNPRATTPRPLTDALDTAGDSGAAATVHEPAHRQGGTACVE